MYEEVEEKVDRLEAILGHFIVRSDTASARSEREMRDFKDEMKKYIGRIDQYIKENRELLQKQNNRIEDNEKRINDTKFDLDSFKIETQEHIKEMKESNIRAEKDTKSMKKQWGKLANKMGTIVEDIVYPAVKPVIKKYFNTELIQTGIHIKRYNKTLGLKGEFDIVALSEDKVFLFEVKSTPSEEYLNKFINNIEKFKKLFPEYSSLKLIPIFSGLRIEEDVQKLATENSIYAMAYREWDYMDILNFNELNK